MAYVPTIWKDRAIEKPRTFTLQNNVDGTVTLVPVPGVVVEAGTPVNAANLNKLEQGLKTHEGDGTAHGIDNIKSRVENTEYNIYQLYLQNYYESKNPYRKALFFDGFINDTVIDTINSTVILNTLMKSVETKDKIIIEQLEKYSIPPFGNTATNSKIAQTVVIPNGIDTITNLKISVWLSKDANPSDGVVCELYTAENDIPKTLLVTSNTVSASSITTSSSGSVVEFVFNGVSLVSGNYAFALKRTGSFNATNYFRALSMSGNLYENGKLTTFNGTTWTASSTTDLAFKFESIVPSEMYYQSKAQSLSQTFNNAVLYVKSQVKDGCSVSPEIAIYTDSIVFEPMVLVSSVELDGGYKEDKFVYSGLSGNNTKIKITLNRPDVFTSYEVSEYGCILGVL